MTIIETLDCPKCHNESVDVVLENGEISVIGGCITCDHQPDIDDVEMVIHNEHCCGCSLCEGEM
jgi:hypothetical protein